MHAGWDPLQLQSIEAFSLADVSAICILESVDATNFVVEGLVMQFSCRSLDFVTVVWLPAVFCVLLRFVPLQLMRPAYFDAHCRCLLADATTLIHSFLKRILLQWFAEYDDDCVFLDSVGKYSCSGS